MGRVSRVRFKSKTPDFELNSFIDSDSAMERYGDLLFRMLALGDSTASERLPSHVKKLLKTVSQGCDVFFENTQGANEDRRLAIVARDLANLYKNFKKQKIKGVEQLPYLKNWAEYSNKFLPINPNHSTRFLFNWERKAIDLQGPVLISRNILSSYLAMSEKTLERKIKKNGPNLFPPNPINFFDSYNPQELLNLFLCKVLCIKPKSALELVKKFAQIQDRDADEDYAAVNRSVLVKKCK